MPVFMGVQEPNAKALVAAVCMSFIGIGFFFSGWIVAACGTLLAASVTAAVANQMFSRAAHAAKTRAVHRSYPAFIRLAYLWSVLAALLGVLASLFDHHHGFWGASRHALTVGFLATMVVAVGQRVLPHFAALRSLFSPRLMLFSMLLLSIGCA